MVTVRFDDQPWGIYSTLDAVKSAAMLDAIDLAVDLLEDNPGDERCRRRSFGGGRWGIPVRDRVDDWLIIWEADDDVIFVRYIGPDPFASR